MLADFGFQHHRGAASPVLPSLKFVLASVPIERAGTRLRGINGLETLLTCGGSIAAVAASHLGATARPVRALLFDKSNENNWSLGWHQDRTIAVVDHCDVEGFGPWTIKAGMTHVEPPTWVQARMITLRIHLDSADPSNAPLLVAPGSHRLGRIPQADVVAVAQRCGTATCIAEAGDVWAYSTPILHASDASARPCHRRVLQIDYAADELPGGLRWLGI